MDHLAPDELTRRIWLLRLGSGAVLTGVSGVHLVTAAQPVLPPGLYEPSVDHLAHVLKPAAGTAAAHQAPRFFTAAEYEQVAILVGKMLGEDSKAPPVPEITAWIDLLLQDAGAVGEGARSLSTAHRALAAAFYGEEVVHELETRDARQICRVGMARWMKNPSEALESLESGQDPFIGWLKRRVIEGFYTSEAGLNELYYKGNSFYSVCPGCEH